MPISTTESPRRFRHNAPKASQAAPGLEYFLAERLRAYMLEQPITDAAPQSPRAKAIVGQLMAGCREVESRIEAVEPRRRAFMLECYDLAHRIAMRRAPSQAFIERHLMPLLIEATERGERQADAACGLLLASSMQLPGHAGYAALYRGLLAEWAPALRAIHATAAEGRRIVAAADAPETMARIRVSLLDRSTDATTRRHLTKLGAHIVEAVAAAQSTSAPLLTGAFALARAAGMEVPDALTGAIARCTAIPVRALPFFVAPA